MKLFFLFTYFLLFLFTYKIYQERKKIYLKIKSKRRGKVNSHSLICIRLDFLLILSQHIHSWELTLCCMYVCACVVYYKSFIIHRFFSCQRRRHFSITSTRVPVHKHVHIFMLKSHNKHSKSNVINKFINSLNK